MRRKTWLVAVSVAGIGFVFGFVGCDDDSGSTQVSNTFVVQYSDRSQIDENETALAILYSADGSEVLDVKEIGDDPVIFTNVPSDRVTITTVTTCLYVNGSFTAKETTLTTYLNVPVGSWHYGVKDYSELGNVRVSVSYPEDSYEYLYVASQTPSGYVSTAEQMMWTLSSTTEIGERVVGSIEDLTISVVARLGMSSDGSYYAGVLKDQPFQPFGDNNYSMELSSDFVDKTITFPENLNFSSVAFFLNGKCQPTYHADLHRINQSESEVHYPAGLENELCGVQAGVREGNISRYTTQFFQEVPSSVTVPEGEVNYLYDSAVNNVTNIMTNTDAKVMLGSWSWFASDTPNSFQWDVFAAVEDGELRMPQLPDSLYELLGFDDEDMLLGYISAKSYNTVSSFNDYIEQYFDPADPGWIEYDSYTAFTKFTGLGWSDTETPFPDVEHGK